MNISLSVALVTVSLCIRIALSCKYGVSIKTGDVAFQKIGVHPPSSVVSTLFSKTRVRKVYSSIKESSSMQFAVANI